MAKVNIVEGSQVQVGGRIGGELSAGQMLQAGAGEAQLGREIQQASRVLGGMAQKLQGAKNAADLAAASARMDSAFAEYQEEMQTENDETKWKEGWQKKATAVGDELLSQDLAPDVKDALGIKLEQWNAQTSISVSGAQTKRTVQRYKAKFLNAAEVAWNQGRLEEGDAFVDEAVKAGVLFDTEADGIKIRGHRQSDVMSANKAILRDPLGAEEDLNEKTDSGEYANFKNLDLNQRQALTVEAQTAMNKNRSKNYQDIQEQIDNGRYYSKEDLDKHVESKMLTSTQAKNISRQQVSTFMDPEANDRAMQALRDASAYNPADDRTQKEQFRILASLAGLPQSVQNQVMRRLRLSETASSSNAAQTKLAVDRINQMHRDSFFGLVTKTDGVYDDAEEASIANTTYREHMLAFGDFMAENPHASPRKQDEFLTERFQKVVEDPEVVVGFFQGLVNTFSGRVDGEAARENRTLIDENILIE
jgi:hypothetical protein